MFNTLTTSNHTYTHTERYKGEETEKTQKTPAARHLCLPNPTGRASASASSHAVPTPCRRSTHAKHNHAPLPTLPFVAVPHPFAPTEIAPRVREVRDHGMAYLGITDREAGTERGRVGSRRPPLSDVPSSSFLGVNSCGLPLSTFPMTPISHE